MLYQSCWLCSRKKERIVRRVVWNSMRKSHTSRAVRHMRVPLLLLMEGFTEGV